MNCFHFWGVGGWFEAIRLEQYIIGMFIAKFRGKTSAKHDVKMRGMESKLDITTYGDKL